MICITICDFGFDACRQALKRCEKYLGSHPDIMAEVRLDLCGLNEKQLQRLFYSSKIPLIATCRRRSRELYLPAVMAGAAYVDIDGIQSDSRIREILDDIGGHKVGKILSYQNFQNTPSMKELVTYFNKAVSLGADVVKIVTTAQDHEDAERLLSLYRMQKEGQLDAKVKLVAYTMGIIGAYSAIESYSMGAPFLFCTLNPQNQLYPGMLTLETYEWIRDHHSISGRITIPGSKDLAQKAIIASLLATGTSTLSNFSPCGDTETALSIAQKRARKVQVKDDTIIIEGQGVKRKLKEEVKPGGYMSAIRHLISGGSSDLSFEDTNFVGESGLLAGLMMPIVAQVGHQVTVSGEGELQERVMSGSKNALEQFGASCVLTSENTLPALICGPLVGTTATVSCRDGARFVSGLVMSLPLSKQDSVLTVKDVNNWRYLQATIDTVRKFGVNLQYKFEDSTTLVITIPGGQRYYPSNVILEGDWSIAANFVVAAAIFGELDIYGLDRSSSQADIAILKIVEKVGAKVKFYPNHVTVTSGHLVAFEQDVTENPDLFPILAVLAAYCEGTSVITGLDSVKYRQTMRVETMCSALRQIGVRLSLLESGLSITGNCIMSRILENSLLAGGECKANGDHRVAMALKIAGIRSESKVSLDDMDCVKKSFPQFRDTLNLIKKK